MRSLLLAALLLVSGCATVDYYRQTAVGHLNVLRQRVPMERAIASPGTDPATRARLTQVDRIRDFAIRALQLPDNGSYRSYADLQRPYVLWNVFATPTLSLRAVQSCFPLVGCLDYRGYYHEADARRYAAQLQQQGHDVYVGGVAAYSTLGWFTDPVLNTMLRWSETELAGVIFHELAHQKLYVRDDSAFNESFATAVQEEGVRRWLEQRNNPDLRAATELETRRREDFLRLVETTRARLQQLYGSGQASEQMLASKQQVFAELQSGYAQVKQGWGGYNGYDAWFGSDLNNAKLLAVTAYHGWVPAFRRMLREEDGDLDRFYADAALAARLTPEARKQWMESWRAMDEASR